MEPARPAEQPVVSEPARQATRAAPALPVAARAPVAPLPEQVRDLAVGGDEHRERAELASSDPAGVELPARLEMKAHLRSSEDPEAERP